MKTLRELLLDLNQKGFGTIDNFDSMDVDEQFSIIKRHYHRRCLQTHPDKGGDIEGTLIVFICFDSIPFARFVYVGVNIGIIIFLLTTLLNQSSVPYKPPSN